MPVQDAARQAVAHRGGLGARVENLRPRGDLFERLGGQGTVHSIVDSLYDAFENDELIRPMFSQKSLDSERERQKVFFEDWLGGPAVWNAYRGLLERHRTSPISRGAAGRWLQHFKTALGDAQIADDLRRELLDVTTPLALGMVHERDAEAPRRVSLACPQTWREPARLAARGDLSAIRTLLDENAEFSRPGDAGLQILLNHAASRGRAEMVELLLDRGADVNRADGSLGILAVTPLFAARSSKAKSAQETSRLLVNRGALDDVFTASALGDVEALKKFLDDIPDLVSIEDPAMDLVCVRPIDHAIANGQVHSLELLLQRGASVEGHDGNAAMNSALSQPKAGELVSVLLTHGAKLDGIEPGPWILDEALDERLARHGLDLSASGGDWIEYTTAHHGNRENAAMIRRFLERGVDPNSRDPKQRTAMHCATRVGFLETLEVLLKHGADVNAQDEVGNTPLAYVAQARKGVDLRAVTQLLLEAGADPTLKNAKGRSPEEQFTQSKSKDVRALVQVLASFRA